MPSVSLRLRQHCQDNLLRTSGDLKAARTRSAGWGGWGTPRPAASTALRTVDHNTVIRWWSVDKPAQRADTRARLDLTWHTAVQTAMCTGVVVADTQVTRTCSSDGT